MEAVAIAKKRLNGVACGYPVFFERDCIMKKPLEQVSVITIEDNIVIDISSFKDPTDAELLFAECCDCMASADIEYAIEEGFAEVGGVSYYLVHHDMPK